MYAKRPDQEATARRRLLVDACHLAVLNAFAVAQPLFELLGRRPEFFAVRRSEPIDLWLLAVTLCLALPLPLILLEMLAYAVHRRLQRLLHGVLCAALIAAIVLPPLERSFAAKPWLELGVALLAGGALALALDRWRPVRLLASFLIPVLAIFPAVFLLRPGIVRILSPQAVETATTAVTTSTTPIVLIIFDELPVTSLLAGPNEIDAERYPHFASLADGATWHRYAVTASDFTVLAVPAILSGRLPDAPRLPLAPDHPQSLFTLLADRYVMNVSESVTQICPASLCGDDGRAEGLGDRLRSLAADLWVLYLHVLLPDDWTEHLPPVNQNWMLFADRDDWASDWRRRGRGDRAVQVDRFLDGIVPTQGPVLHLLHVLLPHPPFDYLPSGQRYSSVGDVPGIKRDVLADDTWTAVQIQQRHLLQVGYIDQVLGSIVDRLRHAGLWDRSVVAVTADHGAGFRAGRHRRKLAPNNFAEILSVPLLIKAPGQSESRLDLRPMSLIDLLPTVADLAGVEVPWPIDGFSLADPATPGRQRLTVVPHRKTLKPHEYSATDVEVADRAALETLDERFGKTAGGGRDLYHIGREQAWVGRRLSDLPLAAPTPFKFRLRWPPAALDVEPGGTFVPAHLSGVLVEPTVEAPVDLAIAVNGRIAAVTTSRSFEPERWSAVVDPAVFRQGVNQVDLIALTRGQDEDSDPILRPVPAMTAPPIAGLVERGLYGVEEWPRGAVRWTDGDAEVTVPIHRSRPPDRLRLTIVGNAPKGGRLRLSAGGKRLLNVRLKSLGQDGTWSKTIDLSGVEMRDELTIGIESSSFVPNQWFQSSPDERRLGVAILGFELLREGG